MVWLFLGVVWCRGTDGPRPRGGSRIGFDLEIFGPPWDGLVSPPFGDRGSWMLAGGAGAERWH